MRKIYEIISLFSILMLVSIALNFLLGLGTDSSAISYDIIWKYAVLIGGAMLIFEGIQCLPLQNPLLIYFITSAFITLESVFLECMIWNWLEPTLMNIGMLAIWIFLACGIITLAFIQKNIADAKLINQRLEKWRAANCGEADV